MEKATNRLFRTPMKKMTTAITSSRDVMMLFSRSLTIWRMNLDWSASTRTSTPSGQVADWRSTSAFTASLISMMLAPDRLVTERVTAALPFIRE